MALSFRAEYVSRPSGLFCVRRGPLVYALPVKEQWNKIEYVRNAWNGRYPYCDYELLPLSPWNYGFMGGELAFHQGTVGDCPFSPEGAPVWIEPA